MSEPIAESLLEIARQIELFRYAAYPIPVPKKMFVRVLKEWRNEEMTDILTYEADLPAVPEGTDVASQSFEVVVNGESQGVLVLDVTVETTPQFDVPQDSDVVLNLFYTDDAGNQGRLSTQTFVAIDTIGPDAPGDFGEVRLLSERTEYTTEEEPAEPPVEEPEGPFPG